MYFEEFNLEYLFRKIQAAKAKPFSKAITENLI